MKNISQDLKTVLIYPTLGISVFSVTYLAYKHVDIHLLGRQIVIRYFKVVFLCTMIGFAIPSFKKINVGK
jgi:hypothetical protein